MSIAHLIKKIDSVAAFAKIHLQYSLNFLSLSASELRQFDLYP